MIRRKRRGDGLVHTRTQVQQNQTGSGKHADRRLRRNRDRASQQRNAINEQKDQT